MKITWPATEEHIRKYTTQNRRMFTETPDIYQNIVLPFIQSFPPSRLDWVLAILDGKKEAERLLYRDDHPTDGFVILPDLKWDGVSLNALVRPSSLLWFDG